MLTAAERNARAQAIAEVREYMRRHKLSLEDLIEVGGEDLRAANPKRRRKAVHVEKCWALMARGKVKHIDLETVLPHEFAAAAVPEPDFRPRRRRHSAVVTQAIEKADTLPSATTITNPNEINDLAVSSPVGASAAKSAEISAAILTRCSEEAATVPGDDLQSWSDEERKVAHE